jgi:hypothetical protein
LLSAFSEILAAEAKSRPAVKFFPLWVRITTLTSLSYLNRFSKAS